MASLAPFVPGLEINTRYARATTPQTANLHLYAFGPAAYLLRYANADERELGRLGQHDPVGTLLLGSYRTSYAWPSLPLGATIDADYVKLHAKNARLQYWNVAAGTMTRTGLNKITHPTVNFVSNGQAYPADAVFADRGVRVGDRVRITGLNGAEEFVLHTYVQGFEGTLATPSGTALAAQAGNAALRSASAVVTADGANSGDVTAVSSAAAFYSVADDILSDTYVITVTQASTGGDATTAKLSVVSASGLDDVAEVTPAAFGAATAIGTRGLTVTFSASSPDNMLLGESWSVVATQLYAVPVYTPEYTYAPPDSRDREYLIEVLRSGRPTDSPLLRISEIRGLDVSQTVAPYDNGGVFVPFNVGSYGVTIDALSAATGLVLGDKWVMTVKAAVQTTMRTLVLAHSLPSGVLYDDDEVDLAVQLFIADDIEIPIRSAVPGNFNFEINNFELLVAADVVVTHPSWTLNGVLQPLTLAVPEGTTDTSILYVTYRAWLPRSATMLSFQDPAVLDTLLDGPGGDPDNVLKYTLGKAAIVADGRPIYFYNVGDPTVLENWSRALVAADETRDVYGLVPLTRDTAVLDLVAGHVNSRSGPQFNMPRCAWFTNEDVLRAVVVSAATSTDSEAVLATISDNPDQTGTQYTLVEVTTGNSDFVTKGVRAGDTLRINFATDLYGDQTYAEYQIASVINESSLILSSGPPAAETVAKLIEVHRVLTAEERVQAFTGAIDGYTGSTEVGTVSSAGRYPGQLFRFLASGYVLDGSHVVPSYVMAAVLSAYRSALAPHQAMTRIAVPGFSGVVGIEDFNTEQLNRIAGAGGFIVVPDVRTGQLVVRHGITAGDFDDVNLREESVQSNVDSIKGYLFNLLDPYIGQTNVTDETLSMIDAELVAGRGFLRSANYAPGLGGQLIDLRIVDLRQSPIAKDSILSEVDIEVPGPTNRIRLNLLVI